MHADGARGATVSAPWGLSRRCGSLVVQVVRIDMHVHSSASFDCDVPPHVMARRLQSYGMTPVFLTDHDTLTGVLELWNGGSVVAGQEVTTTQGELIGLFLKAQVPA